MLKSVYAIVLKTGDPTFVRETKGTYVNCLLGFVNYNTFALHSIIRYKILYIYLCPRGQKGSFQSRQDAEAAIRHTETRRRANRI